jgi:transposase
LIYIALSSCCEGGDTLLRILHQLGCPHSPTPEVLGIDDWAWRKGDAYGTLLCDLVEHRVVDILPDREADTLVAWLQAHPGVKIISRDRDTGYAKAARTGAPEAVQVARSRNSKIG